jgi:predicted SAM-dependent methyltransferase
MQFLNVACGDIFVVSNLWENCDFAPKTNEVNQVDILSGLPYEDNTFDVVYCSHFIEHIPKSRILDFLQECNRVTKPNGLIRLVLPDFENIAREYLYNIEQGNESFAEFNIIEMIDQCTRVKSGGEMVKYFRQSADVNLQEYVKLRTGHEPNSDHIDSSIFMRLKRANFKKVKYKVQRIYSRILIELLPSWFKVNHISMTETGEKHFWVYDFHTIKNILQNSGYFLILRKNAYESSNPEFPIYPLDIDSYNQSRKGELSMYIEAVKV